MTKPVVKEEKNKTSRRAKLVSVSLLLLIAMLASVTLAWFVQLLGSEGNQITSAGVEQLQLSLLKQELTSGNNADDSFKDPAGGNFTDGQDGVSALTNFMETPLPANPVRFVDNSSSTDEFRPLAEASFSVNPGELGYNAVKKRLILQNGSPDPVQVMLGFSINDYFELTPEQQADYGERGSFLPEAIRVEVYTVTKQPDGAWKTSDLPIASFDHIGAEELNKLSLRPELPAASGGVPSDTVYEFCFTMDPGASALYAGGEFTMDITLDGFGSVGDTYYIRDAEDVKKVFGYYEYQPRTADNAAPADGDTIDHYDYVYHAGQLNADNATVVLLNDITYDGDIRVANLFNLNTDGYDFVCTGTLTVDIPAADSKWGTVDFGATSNMVTDTSGAVLRSSQLLFTGGFRASQLSKDQYDASEFYLAASGGLTADKDQAAQTGVLLNAPNVAFRWIAPPSDPTPADDTAPYGTQPSGDSIARRFNGRTGGNGFWRPTP